MTFKTKKLTLKKHDIKQKADIKKLTLNKKS